MSFISILKDHLENRNMFWQLAKNDLKARYATSVLGIAWAFIQPLCTVLVLWFVFQVGLRSADIGGIPFIVWYAPAYLVWSFFQESVSGMTGCIKEYHYLVRKVNFRISLIPTVKLVPGIFVHLGFFVFIICLNLIYGNQFHLSNLQMVYYFVCAIAYAYGLGLICATIAPFAGDIQSIVNVIMTVGFWATPIVWNIDNVSGFAKTLLKINPMFYICNGYRDAWLTHTAFWEHPWTSLSFWGITIVLILAGSRMFRKLSPQFADVL
ncbi:MAG: ABC transporter permease [Clostridia bacterium]|nr:ABC transporter permease [Clostridia bacterium]